MCVASLPALRCDQECTYNDLGGESQCCNFCEPGITLKYTQVITTTEAI